MTQKQLIIKSKSLLKDAQPLMLEKIQRAIKSGCMDIEGAEDNFLLPKCLVSAIFKEMQFQFSPHTEESKKQVNIIYREL